MLRWTFRSGVPITKNQPSSIVLCSFEYFTGALNKYIRLVGL